MHVPRSFVLKIIMDNKSYQKFDQMHTIINLFVCFCVCLNALISGTTSQIIKNLAYDSQRRNLFQYFSFWQVYDIVDTSFLLITYRYYHACIPRRVRQRCTNAHPLFAGMFRSHLIGGEPNAINRAQILIPSCY